MMNDWKASAVAYSSISELERLNPSGDNRKTLRDEFAMAALPHCMADAVKGYGHIFPDLAARAVKAAYECADAMMKAREQKTDPDKPL